MPTLRQILRRELALLVGLLTIAVLAVSAWSLWQLMQAEWHQRVRFSARFLAEDVQDALQDAEGLGRDVAALAALGVLDPQRPEAVTESLAALLGHTRFVRAVALCAPDGRACFVERPDLGHAPSASPLASASSAPWFRKAIQLGKPVWSHTVQDTPPARQGLVLGVPAFAPGGELRAVVRIDLRYQDLEDWLAQGLPSEGSRILLVDQRAGVRILEPRPEGAPPRPLAAPGLEAARRILETLSAGRPHRVHGEGRSWFGMRQPVQDVPGMELHLALLVPESEMIRKPGFVLFALLAMGVVTVSLTFWATSRTAQRLARPLERLARENGTGEGTVDSGVEEIRRLEEALKEAAQQRARELEMEHRLQQNQRMETLGALAGGVAHDLNNQLMAIQGQIELGRLDLPADATAQGHLLAAEEAVLRGSGILRALVTYSRGTTPGRHRIDLNTVVERTGRLLERLLGQRILLALDLEPIPLEVMADEVQMEQVLMNLALNARDAMPRGGRLSVVTRRTPGQAVLEVTDTGSGIPEALRARIFEPFFTTKTEGSGSGLGLSMVQGIVRAHEGQVVVTSKVGEGTRFRIHLPLMAPKAAAAGPRTRNLDHLRILVVEDEPHVADILHEALKTLGAEVQVARDGEEGWQHFQSGTFDLVLSDQRMPRLKGLELLARLREREPELPVILMSGHGLEEAASLLAQDPALRFLSKPFPLDALLSTIASLETLSGTASGAGPNAR